MRLKAVCIQNLAIFSTFKTKFRINSCSISYSNDWTSEKWFSSQWTENSIHKIQSESPNTLFINLKENAKKTHANLSIKFSFMPHLPFTLCWSWSRFFASSLIRWRSSTGGLRHILGKAGNQFNCIPLNRPHYPSVTHTNSHWCSHFSKFKLHW